MKRIIFFSYFPTCAKLGVGSGSGWASNRKSNPDQNDVDPQHIAPWGREAECLSPHSTPLYTAGFWTDI
jgi:hypothetical protein